MGRISDPAWKSGPPEPTHSHSEHAIYEDDEAPYDIDGFGVDEVEMVEGEPLVTIQERRTCHRDGCDASHVRRLLFTTEGLTDAQQRRLERHSGADDLAAYAHERAERIDVETIRVKLSGESPDSVENSSDDESVDGIPISAERIVEEEPVGQCNGRPEPPSPEPYGL